MERLDYRTDPSWWAPRLSSFWIGVIRPVRWVWQRRREGLYEVEVRGLESLRAAIARGDGVLIATNHPANPDPFVFLQVADRLHCPFYYMAAWQVFQREGWLGRRVLARHGCFSVNREHHDYRAVRQAVDILQHRPHPLVTLPEGELYHTSDHVHPFRTGAGVLALTAARHARRRIVCIPGALTYRFLDDPTAQLTRLLHRLEQQLHWPAPGSLNLAQRIHRLAARWLSLKEKAYLGGARSGPLAPRFAALAETILHRQEQPHGLAGQEANFTERVVAVRRRVMAQEEAVPEHDPRRVLVRRDLDELRLATQLYSYVPNFEADHPTLECLAEILDKFEEDILDAFRAGVRGRRKAVISFGTPVEVRATDHIKEEAPHLTHTLEDQVRTLLQDLISEKRSGEVRLTWFPCREQKSAAVPFAP